jgi:hypothetical protein
MFKKFKSGMLIIVLIILLIVYLFVRYAGSNDRTFKDKILSFEPASITQILVKDPKSSQEPVDLRFTGDKWMIRAGGIDYPADTNIVKGVLKQLSELPTKRYAGNGKDAWVKYELTDSVASLVTLKAGSKTIAELLIGKFSYNVPKGQTQQMQGRQQRGEMTSYVRLADDKDVYAVDGYLKMSINSSAEGYRYRSLVSVSPSDITRITLNGPGVSNVLENQGGKWLLNGAPADSIQMARYCNALSRLAGSKFVEQKGTQTFPSHTLKLEGNNFSPLEISAYPSADTNIAFVITSSANPGSYFSGKDGGLFKKIWDEKMATGY